jgi:tRNA pseudouridine32 synthase/23S rRNA pseudouridine746 synthase
VHRIDRETAGLVLFTVQPAQRGLYQALFRDRAAAKQYEAIAPWHAGLARPQVQRHRIVPAAHFMQMRQAAPEEGPHNAETRIEMLEAHGALARYRLMPATGQRHQLRVQMAALGAPILHDRIYPVLQPEGPPDYAHPLQLLARGLAFTDPVTGAALAFESGLRLAWPA